MDIELLKEFYYKERRKLEEMWVFKQEGKLHCLRLKEEVIKRAKDRLSVGEILGRNDISDEIKEEFIRPNENKIEEQLDKNIEGDLIEVEREEKEELKATRYSAAEYADYLYQMEKVIAIESKLADNGFLLEVVYEEMRQKELK